jgi:putative oxidoreductase
MKKKFLFVVCLLFGLVFINSGLNKFLNYMPTPKDLPESLVKVMTAFAAIKWLLPLVGAVEIAGGILFITNKYRALGAVTIFPVMIGILLTNMVNAPSGLPLALVLLAINVWVLAENREKYMLMIK